MEVEKKKFELEKKDNEIIYSKAIKAGRRIYYLDVKRSRNDDLYLAITESKKKVTGYDDDVQVTYEKHKIFLYKEDFENFSEGLTDVIGFIEKEQGVATPRAEYIPGTKNEDETDEPTSDDSDENETESSGETKKSFFDKFKF
ncbi:MAG: PUR family DNA/RNA-binding protein [Porphyromonadaceae bacterium]|nr:PUR family DNA/RNA-binding protein [Porphyromonadaceae bacterium]